MSAPPPPSGPAPKFKPTKVIKQTGKSLEEVLKEKRNLEPQIIIDRTVKKKKKYIDQNSL